MKKHTMLTEIFNTLFYHYLKYLALKAGQVRQTHRRVGTLTQGVKQPYHVCSLTGQRFKGVLWGDVNNMKMMSGNISSSLSLVYPNFCIGS